jgi:hypothetical protein
LEVLDELEGRPELSASRRRRRRLLHTTTNPSANYGPGMSPHALYPRTDGPQIDNSDAAGPASVPGTMTAAPIVVPPTAAASPAIIVPPASDTVIVAPPAQPR